MVVVLMTKAKREDGEIVDIDISGITDILLPIGHEEDTSGAACFVPTAMEDTDGGMEPVLDIGVAIVKTNIVFMSCRVSQSGI
jgi:hypothetical protein